jgi:hypothetical protein
MRKSIFFLQAQMLILSRKIPQLSFLSLLDAKRGKPANIQVI